MNILVLAGTGTIGRELINELRLDNDNSINITTRKKRRSFKNVNYITINGKLDKNLDIILNKYFDVIIDFFNYKVSEFELRYLKLLNSTKKYIFISSSRVYSNNKIITENSKRLLDVSNDKTYLNSDEYALEKARQEDLLINSGFDNFYIVRPYITYSSIRLQLGNQEKDLWLNRVLNNKNIILTNEILNSYTTLTHSKDVARAISYFVLNNPKITFINPVSGTKLKWHEILNTYKEIIKRLYGYEIKLQIVSQEDYFKIFSKYQVIYDRNYDRIFDNSLMKKVNGNSFVEIDKGLADSLGEFYKFPTFQSVDIYKNFKIDKLTGDKQSIKSIGGIENFMKYHYYRLKENLSEIL